MALFEDKVIKYGPRMMKDFQIQDFHAAGIFGNMGTETGGFKHLQELNPIVAGSRGGYGWMQWTGPRRKRYEKWASEAGKNPADDETNYLYLVHETLRDEWKSLQQVRKTTTLEAATETFMLLNLRPGIPHLASRQMYAKRALAALQGKPAKAPEKISKPAPAKKPNVVKDASVGSAAVLTGTAALYQFGMTALPFVAVAFAIGLGIYIYMRNK